MYIYSHHCTSYDRIMELISNIVFVFRYYGSRFDNILNLGSDSLSLVADRLANLSTAIAKVFHCCMLYCTVMYVHTYMHMHVKLALFLAIVDSCII